VRFHPPNLAQLDSPIFQCRIGNERRKLAIVDREDFRNNERCRLTDFCK
jgi:hypothetical protein